MPRRQVAGGETLHAKRTAMPCYGIFMIAQSEAIVLRSVDFSETSLILTLYTKNFGKISAIAKGGRRLKGPFESSLDMLTRVNISVIRKQSDSLDILTESKLQWRFRPQKWNLAGLYAAYTAAELLNDFTEPGESSLELYDLLRYTLERFSYVNSAPEQLRGTVSDKTPFNKTLSTSGSEPQKIIRQKNHAVMRMLIRFEWLLLDILGFRPQLDCCVECGKQVNFNRKGRVVFGLSDGGPICTSCRADLLKTGEYNSRISVSIDVLRAVYDIVTTKRTDCLEHLPIGEIRNFTTQYMLYTLGKRPRMYEYLNFISKLDT
ncbi:MAG: DNA repair protein RecO [Thermoguttaceae bacterium]